ncbi:MAG TPA: head GIN domain-containing protein [Bacteroidales bacterium]|nr:head GIN domain-containing protein [Bacteroidales bacterium]HPS62363.1 head GIN domain-containing protein [Bacteroidales bacterium]
MKATKMIPVLFVLAILGTSGILTGCNVTGGVHGDGNVLKETRKVPSFDAIDVSGAFDIVLRQGATEEVVVEADANLLPVIRTEVVGGTLVIETRKPVHHVTTMKAYITVKNLKHIEASGAVDMETEGQISVPELSIDASGASDSKLEIATQKLALDCSGASKIHFKGSATNLSMDLSGASDIFAYELLTESCDIEISGAGNAQLNVSKKIRASISGAGSVKYKGSPTDINQDVSGAGSIRKVD